MIQSDPERATSSRSGPPSPVTHTQTKHAQSRRARMVKPSHPAWHRFIVLVPRRATPPKTQHPDVKCKYSGHEIRSAKPTASLIPHI
jgi:hypothetical protein